MIANGIGLTADSYQSMYVHGGAEIAEAYGGLNYSDPIFYKTQTMTGSAPFVFDSYPGHLTGYTISGNSVQNGTPTPDNPVEVQCVGDLVTTGEHAGEYVIPITCGGVTQNIYLSEPLRKIGGYTDEIDFRTGTVTRRIKEVVLTGNENNWARYTKTYYRAFPGVPATVYDGVAVCNAFRYRVSGIPDLNDFSKGANENLVFNYDDSGEHINDFKAWLSQLYADGTPVIVYHALSNPTTESITIPQIATINGQNTLSIGTTLQPSSMSITGHIKPVTS